MGGYFKKKKIILRWKLFFFFDWDIGGNLVLWIIIQSGMKP